MPYQFFTIPMHDDGAAAEMLNRFIQTHQIANERIEFVQDGSNSAWVVCVCYIQKEHVQLAVEDKTPKVDYRELLSDEGFQVYAKLRSFHQVFLYPVVAKSSGERCVSRWGSSLAESSPRVFRR